MSIDLIKSQRTSRSLKSRNRENGPHRGQVRRAFQGSAQDVQNQGRDGRKHYDSPGRDGGIVVKADGERMKAERSISSRVR